MSSPGREPGGAKALTPGVMCGRRRFRFVIFLCSREAVDVDDAGGLLVRTERGTEVVRFGEVEHLE